MDVGLLGRVDHWTSMQCVPRRSMSCCIEMRMYCVYERERAMDCRTAVFNVGLLNSITARGSEPVDDQRGPRRQRTVTLCSFSFAPRHPRSLQPNLFQNTTQWAFCYRLHIYLRTKPTERISKRTRAAGDLRMTSCLLKTGASGLSGPSRFLQRRHAQAPALLPSFPPRLVDSPHHRSAQ